MTYSLDQAVAWAKLPVSVECLSLPPIEGYFFIISKTGIACAVSFYPDQARRFYLNARNQLAAYLPPEPKPGQNVDVVA